MTQSRSEVLMYIARGKSDRWIVRESYQGAMSFAQFAETWIPQATSLLRGTLSEPLEK
jgi:hypothetical protein